MKQALGERTIAEESDRDRVATQRLVRQSATQRDRRSCSNDAVSAKHANRHVGNMHGSASTTTKSGFLAEQLGEETFQRQALGDGVAVAAMRGGNRILGR